MIWKTHLKNENTYAHNHQRVATTPAAQRFGGRPPTLGESHGELTDKDYFAKQEKIRIFAV